MRRAHLAQANPVDLSPVDVQIIRERIQARTAFWGVRTTRAPGPFPRRDGSRWAYLFWDGPPSMDIVPALAVSRCVDTYQITILDMLELFSRGNFETIQRSDLGDALDLIEALLLEAREVVMSNSASQPTIGASTCARSDLN